MTTKPKRHPILVAVMVAWFWVCMVATFVMAYTTERSNVVIINDI